MNPLATRPALRRKVYGAFWVVGLGLGALVAALGTDVHWLNVALAVYAYLGSSVGYTAQRNTGPAE